LGSRALAELTFHVAILTMGMVSFPDADRIRPAPSQARALLDTPSIGPHQTAKFEPLIQTANEEPQPHDAVALGFLIWNDAPIKSSTKSITDPFSRSSDASSVITATPRCSNT
jgi:hypothetical protein